MTRRVHIHSHPHTASPLSFQLARCAPTSRDAKRAPETMRMQAEPSELNSTSLEYVFLLRDDDDDDDGDAGTGGKKEEHDAGRRNASCVRGGSGEAKEGRKAAEMRGGSSGEKRCASLARRREFSRDSGRFWTSRGVKRNRSRGSSSAIRRAVCRTRRRLNRVGSRDSTSQHTSRKWGGAAYEMCAKYRAALSGFQAEQLPFQLS